MSPENDENTSSCIDQAVLLGLLPSPLKSVLSDHRMIRLRKSQLFSSDLRTRMPFRYGIVPVTRLPHVFLQATVEIGGRTAVGVAADHLPPKWFTKDSSRDPADEVDEMVRVIRRAMAAANGLAVKSSFQNSR